MSLDAILMITMLCIQLAGDGIHYYKSKHKPIAVPNHIYQTIHPEIQIYTLPAVYTTSEDVS